jgi:NTE family protein
MNAPDPSSPTLALVFGGGGARTAYQAGALRYLGEAFPETPISIVAASGMGAFNAALLAGRAQPWPEATREAVEAWTTLCPSRVFEPRSLWDLVTQLVRHAPSPKQSLLDPSPLRRHLSEHLPADADGTLAGVRRSVDGGWLDALALTTTHYASLRTVTWTQGRSLDDWPHERRTARSGPLTVDHVMAAQALALLYPVVALDDEWHGAGAGMLHPLSPALRLGADRVLALSTRPATVETPATDDEPYPSPLQVASILSNTLLLDTLDADAATMDRIDRLACKLPPDERDGLAPTDVHVLRPSVDLTAVASGLDGAVDAALGSVLQYLHGEGTRLPDLLSKLLFEPAYLRRLLLLGYTDARRRHDRLAALLRD